MSTTTGQATIIITTTTEATTIEVDMTAITIIIITNNNIREHHIQATTSILKIRLRHISNRASHPVLGLLTAFLRLLLRHRWQLDGEHSSLTIMVVTNRMATITEIVTEVGWVSIGKQHRATIMGMEAVVAMTEVKVATAMVGAMVITVMAMIGVITIIILEDLGVGMADDVLKLLLCLII